MRESASASTCTSTPPHARATVRILSRARRCRDLRPSSCSFVRQIQEVYSWARCAPPLPAAAMRALGAPLPAAQLADAQQPLAWADFQVRDFLFTCWHRPIDLLAAVRMPTAIFISQRAASLLLVCFYCWQQPQLAAC